MTTRLYLFFVVTIGLSADCGGDGDKPEMGFVRGIVTLYGKSLPNGTVISNPESGRNATGRIQRDGSFELKLTNTARAPLPASTA